jgi:ribose transport system substrate-binding protein
MVFYKDNFDSIIAEQYPNYEIIYHDAQYDFQAMADGLETFINEDVDLIMHFALDNLPVLETYKKINEAGIPLFLTMDEPAYEAWEYMTAFSGLSPAEAGRVCADKLNEALGGEGTYACITPPKGSSSYNMYMTRFYNRLENIGSNLQLVAEEDGNWDVKQAQEKASDILTKYPDIDGFYVTDDWMGGGIVNAAKEKGYQPGDFIIAGCGGAAVGVEDLADGWYYVLVDQGTILCAKQDAFLMKLIVEDLGPVPFYSMVYQRVLTIDDMEGFEPSW